MLPDLRAQLGAMLLRRVAGPDGREIRARIHDTPGPRWFGPDRPIRTVHGDASMFIGGVSALLLQSLHPLAMAAVDAHSGYRGDPWGRLQRTSAFLAVTTYGTAADAQAAVGQVRGIHENVRGHTRQGEKYHAADPHLLGWVHTAETECFLRAHERYGAHRLDPAGYDDYAADTATVAEALGVTDPPRDRGALSDRLERYRPELRATPEARAVARFLLLEPPVPLAARPLYGALAANAVNLLPDWARCLLRLPRVPLVEDLTVRPVGHLLTRTIRWAMAPPPPSP
ncbi:oxygenase MpaB family protein [Streptomyces sp. SAS_269]